MVISVIIPKGPCAKKDKSIENTGYITTKEAVIFTDVPKSPLCVEKKLNLDKRQDHKWLLLLPYLTIPCLK
jgi:hypothetical protein